MYKKKQQIIDQSQWPDDLKKKFNEAKTELEKEQIWEKIQQELEQKEFIKQVLQQGRPVQAQSQDVELEDITNDSLDSMDIEQKIDDIPLIQINKVHIDPNKDESNDEHFQLLKNVVLKRSQIDILLMKHYYNTTIENSYVKIQEQSFKGYVIAQILAVAEGEQQYKFESSNTYKLLKLQFPQFKEPKFRHITQVSNQAIEKSEYTVWKKESERAGLSIPTKEWLNKKINEINASFTSKLNSEQIKKKIIQTIDQWSQGKGCILYHDLVIYIGFMKNQIQENVRYIDRMDEAISEINDTYADSSEIKQEEKQKIINFKRQQQEKKQEKDYLESELKKIQDLYDKYLRKDREKQLSKQPIQSDQTIRKLIQKDEQQTKQQQQLMKNLDQKYVRKYDGIETIQGSEALKEQFLKIHKTQLSIDNYIDQMILEDI
ncbi:RNA polymerase-associated protein rtf1 [Paramecium bursaria]